MVKLIFDHHSWFVAGPKFFISFKPSSLASNQGCMFNKNNNMLALGCDLIKYVRCVLHSEEWQCVYVYMSSS